jgi:hypothetical protein
MNHKFIWALILIMLLSACTSTPTTSQADELSTIVAETMQAIAAEQPESTATPISNIPFSLDGLSLSLPVELASGIETQPEPAALPAEDMPWWGTYPAYTEYPLQGYILPETFHDAKIYVFPLDEYVAMNESVAAKIQSLKDILGNPSQPLPARLPFLPTWNAGEAFHSNVEFVSFQNGSGIRYITQYGQAPLPVNNYEVFYTFQGITSDGKYYVAAVLPISAPFLAGYPSPEYPTPPDGIPFDWDNWENTEAYVIAVAEKLSATDSAIFTPSLTTLDTFIQSILVTGTP